MFSAKYENHLAQIDTLEDGRRVYFYGCPRCELDPQWKDGHKVKGGLDFSREKEEVECQFHGIMPFPDYLADCNKYNEVIVEAKDNLLKKLHQFQSAILNLEEVAKSIISESPSPKLRRMAGVTLKSVRERRISIDKWAKQLAKDSIEAGEKEYGRIP